MGLVYLLTGALLHSETIAQVPRIQGQGTAASGMGNAFAAQADDASALHYNPAGLTHLPRIESMAGGLLTGGATTFTGANGTTARGDRNGSMAWPPPAHFYLTANLPDLGVTLLGPLAVGIGLTVPFGSLTRWPTDGPFRTATVFSSLPLLDVKPTLAYRLTESLSIGLGADIYTFSQTVGEGHVERQSIWPGGFGIPAGARVELFGRDTAAGFNASILYTALRNNQGKPIANVGFVYRSQATMHLSGALLANGSKVSDATATFVLPQVMTGAIALWPVRTIEREWKLELDVDHVSWSTSRNLDVHLANGATIPQPLKWRDTYAVMAGTEYKWLALDSMPGWDVALRAGYTNQQNQVPDQTFDPGIPSSDVHIVGGGIGLLCQKQGRLFGWMKCGEMGIGAVKTATIGLDFSYQASLYEDRTVVGNRNPTVNGTYKTTLHSGGVSIRLSF
ncbi:putative long-chain fatty acid outer membrane transporter [Nitrospira sp. KM1]|uniref:OmpP1/FadL family transporter n=1 Tax=Nitrospira sp. KM1 TaxID=1936990 RepID=UPI0013A78E42|nr:outer membrane protein transport protein [Nitrospira sp. KM1]BCA53693.1 putative long-chain fatty acid outer membrane transporter [Nitrospira sp. KM1]